MNRIASLYTLLTIGLTLLLMQACAPVYVPNVINSPLFGDKMEFTGGGSVGLSGIDAQAAFTPVKHLGITGGFSYRDRQPDVTRSREHLFGEGGLGYYSALGQKTRFEVYGGYGRGHAKANYHSGSGWFETDVEGEGKYQRFYVQPGFGLATDIVDLSIAMRGSYVNFRTYSGGDPDRPLSSFFIEPAVTAKVGYKWVRVFMQFGLSLPTTKDVRFEHDPIIFSVGAHVYLRKYKKADAGN